MAEPKIVVFGLNIHENKEKRKAMKAIASIKGIDSMDMNMKDKKLTVIGFFDELRGVERLIKVGETKLLVVEKVKKGEPKKEEPKKEEPKKEKEPKKEDEKKYQNQNIVEFCTYEQPYHPCMMPHHFIVTTVDEYPTYNCVIIC